VLRHRFSPPGASGLGSPSAVFSAQKPCSHPAQTFAAPLRYCASSRARADLPRGFPCKRFADPRASCRIMLGITALLADHLRRPAWRALQTARDANGSKIFRKLCNSAWLLGSRSAAQGSSGRAHWHTRLSPPRRAVQPG
jgi:hypothetical protein